MQQDRARLSGEQDIAKYGRCFPRQQAPEQRMVRINSDGRWRGIQSDPRGLLWSVKLDMRLDRARRGRDLHRDLETIGRRRLPQGELELKLVLSADHRRIRELNRWPP